EIHGDFSGVQKCRDGGGGLLPAGALGVQLTAAGGGEAIVTGAAAVFGGAPAGGDPAGGLHAVQRGVERPLLDPQEIAGDLVDVLGDAEAVHAFLRAALQGVQHQQVERALEVVCSHRRLWYHRTRI